MQYTDHQIEEYLEGKMREDAALIFEKTMNDDFELRYRVESFRIIIESIRYAGFRDNIISIENNLKKKPTRKLSFAGRVAVSIVLVIVSSWVLDVIFGGGLFSDLGNSNITPNDIIKSELIDEYRSDVKEDTIKFIK